EGDLVVARARGVEAAGGFADSREELGFHRHVDVLLGGKLELARTRLVPDGHQALVDPLRILARDESGLGEHAQMRQAADEVGAQEREVRQKRAGEGEDLGKERRALRGGAGAGDAHVSPPDSREKSRSGRPESSMSPAAARWSKRSASS